MENFLKYVCGFPLLTFAAFGFAGCSGSEPEPKDPVPVRVLVSGAVKMPGLKTFWISAENPDPPSLSYAIAMSGGPAANAYLDEVVVRRNGFWGERNIGVNLREIMFSAKPKDFPLEDGDIVEVGAVNLAPL